MASSGNMRSVRGVRVFVSSNGNGTKAFPSKGNDLQAGFPQQAHQKKSKQNKSTRHTYQQQEKKPSYRHPPFASLRFPRPSQRRRVELIESSVGHLAPEGQELLKQECLGKLSRPGRAGDKSHSY